MQCFQFFTQPTKGTDSEQATYLVRSIQEDTELFVCFQPSMVISHDARAYTHTHAKIERWGGGERGKASERETERMGERE